MYIYSAIGFRNTISTIYPIWNLISFFSVPAMKDAKQVTTKDEKPKISCCCCCKEYCDLLTNPSCYYILYMLILNFPIYLYGSYVFHSVSYWLFITFGLAQEDYFVFALATYMTGLVMSCCCNCFWGIGFFGKTSKKGREYSVNPLYYALASSTIAFIIGTIVYFTLYRPIDRQTLLNGGKNQWTKLYVGGVITGLFVFPQQYWSSAAWQWAIDFDNQSRDKKGHKRTEAIIVTLSLAFNFGAFEVGSGLAKSIFTGNPARCDTTIHPGYQPEECYMFLYYSYFYPALFLFPWGLAGMYFYPLKGEKLKQLYRKQGDYQDAVEHTDSWATFVHVEQPQPVQTVIPSNVMLDQENSQPDVVQQVIGNPLD